jgi:hypothetical protein
MALRRYICFSKQDVQRWERSSDTESMVAVQYQPQQPLRSEAVAQNALAYFCECADTPKTSLLRFRGFGNFCV